MATVKIILRTQKTNKDGEAPLCIRITKNRVSKFIFLDYRIEPKFWDKKEKVVKKGHPQAPFLNKFIAHKVAEAQTMAMEMETELKFVASRDIKESIKGKSAVEFFPFAERFSYSFKSAGKIGTYRRANSVIEKLKKYVECRKITFDTITVTFLKNYEYYLQAKLKNRINTVNANFKLIRTIFNNAIREDLIPAEINPFNKMKLKVEHTERAYLTEEELNKVEAMEINENYMLNHHRNIYVFSAYSGGLRISDILTLRWSNFDGEKINIRIRKTKMPLTVKLPSKAIEILKFYAKEDGNANDFIFPLLKMKPEEKDPEVIHDAISKATAYANKNLKIISKHLKIEKHISFHTSRHTWATRALTKGMRIEHVSKLMGHAALRETQIYARIINSELEQAMDVFN